MKKIVCTVTNDLVNDQRMHRICDSLLKRFDTVILVGRVLPFSQELSPHNFDQIRIPCRFNKGPIFYLEYNFRLLAQLIKLKPNYINTIDLDTGLAAYLYRTLVRVPWSFDSHEHFTEVPELVNRKFVKRIWGWMERIIFNNADCFYTVSHSLSEIFQKKYKKKVEVIRNVPFLRSNNVVKPKSENSESGFLIYQGALNEGRCIDLYIKAMHHIDAHLVLVGEGDLSAELRNLVDQEKLSEKVQFKGKLRPEELRQLTQKASMGLNVLANNGLSYYYSLSNKCFDYIQAGIPQISSDFPEYQKINEEHDVMLLVEPTIDAIVEAITELQNNLSLHKRLKENCKKAANTLTWENEESKLLAQYE